MPLPTCLPLVLMAGPSDALAGQPACVYGSSYAMAVGAACGILHLPRGRVMTNTYWHFRYLSF